jgi:CheY-like chemotaxis protein
MAGCAIPTRSAGHAPAGAKADPKLTFGPDHLVGPVILTEITNAEGVHVRLQADPEAVVRTTLSDEPSLIILEHHPPEIDGLAICRSIRAQPGSYVADVPIALVASEEDVDAGIAAGVTAWLVSPFSAVYARSRLRTAVLRLR